MVKEQGAAADEQGEVLGHVALLDRVHADVYRVRPNSATAGR